VRGEKGERVQGTRDRRKVAFLRRHDRGLQLIAPLSIALYCGRWGRGVMGRKRKALRGNAGKKGFSGEQGCVLSIERKKQKNSSILNRKWERNWGG